MAEQQPGTVVGEILFEKWDSYPCDRGMQALWFPVVDGGLWDGTLLVMTHVDTRDPYRMAESYLCDNRNEAILKVAELWENLR